jgi:hypothetical protein
MFFLLHYLYRYLSLPGCVRKILFDILIFLLSIISTKRKRMNNVELDACYNKTETCVIQEEIHEWCKLQNHTENSIQTESLTYSLREQ